MPQPRSDKPTTRKSRSASSTEAARSAADVTDERYVWSGKVFQVFSISNIEGEPWYVRLDVSNLARDDYALYIEEGPLFATEAPFQVFPPRFESQETPEEGNPLILSSRFEHVADPPGSMVAIPPRRQLNITMRLRRDCHERQDFRVTVYRHFGRTRESDFHKGRPLSREFFQIPEADTCAVEMEVLTRTAHFRPWNLAGRRSHFFWNLAFFGRPLFNRPEFQVQAQNRGSLPVNVRAHLFKAAGPEKKAFGVDGPEETLEPGQECVWTFPLWLRDAEEADQATFEASMEVRNGRHKIKDIAAGDKVSAVYHPRFSLPKDLIALVGILGFAVCGLVWLCWGIPVMVTPEVGVYFQFDGQSRGELPKGINGSDFALAELDENGDQIKQNSNSASNLQIPLKVSPIIEGDKNIYYCELPPRLMGYRWPFGWNGYSSQEHHFKVVPSENFKANNRFVWDDKALIFNVSLVKTSSANDALASTDRPLIGHFPPVFGSVAFHDREKIKLNVTFNLDGQARAARTVTVKCIVQAADGPPKALPDQTAGIAGGQVAFSVPFYTEALSAGIPATVTVTATTNNGFTGGGHTEIKPGDKNITITAADFAANTPDVAPPVPPVPPVVTPPGGQTGPKGAGTPDHKGQGGEIKHGPAPPPPAPPSPLQAALAALNRNDEVAALAQCGDSSDPALLAIKSIALNMQAIPHDNDPKICAQADAALSKAVDKKPEAKGLTLALIASAQGYQQYRIREGEGVDTAEPDKQALDFFDEACKANPSLAYPYMQSLRLRVEKGEGSSDDVQRAFDIAYKQAPEIVNLRMFKEEILDSKDPGFKRLQNYIRDKTGKKR